MSGPTPSAAPSEMTISDELLAPVTSDVELCYQTFGDPDAEPLLLVMGLGGPMTWWDTDLCTQLAAQGFHVIRYDNRDIGRSSRSPGTVRRSTRHLSQVCCRRTTCSRTLRHRSMRRKWRRPA